MSETKPRDEAAQARQMIERNACSGLTDSEVVEMRRLWDKIQQVADMAKDGPKVMPVDCLPEKRSQR
jgi:hypothetical protein